MNNIINDDVIEKVVIKSVAIYKAMSVLPAPPFEDKFVKKEDICQQNEIIQNQNLEKCLNEIEPSKEKETIDTTNETKSDYEKKSWKDITDPKERRKAYKKAYREFNKEQIKIKDKAYRVANKDKIRIKRKSYDNINKDRIKEYKKMYRKLNKDEIKVKDKAYRVANKDKLNSHRNNRLKTDIQFKISHSLRVRMGTALEKNYKSGSAVKDLGCTIEELKQYLESKFQSGMSWDNWSKDGWHIDHIKPLASFDLTDRQQFLEACHYTNLQPLWAKDNIIKGDNIV